MQPDYFNVTSPLFGQANQPSDAGSFGFSESANNRRLELQMPFYVLKLKGNHMRPSTIMFAISSLVVISFFIGRTPGVARTGAPIGMQDAAGRTLVFALAKDSEGTFRTEAIVIIGGGKYTPPPAGAEAGVLKKFTDTYLRVGRQYRVIFGGGDAGSMTIRRYEADMCGNLIAEVDAQTTARLGGEVQALAVSSDKIGGGTSSRRAPTEAERASVLEVARAVYGQRRVGAALARKMKTINLTATDIDRDGKFEMIGTFQIEAGSEVMHNLFIIFEPAGNGEYKAAWNWYQKGTEDRKLVDVVDLDGDNKAEVIAEGFDIENNFYVIYKRQAGVWRPVYKGGGGGAC
jgi:hypothetical protein